MFSSISKSIKKSPFYTNEDESKAKSSQIEQATQGNDAGVIVDLPPGLQDELQATILTKDGVALLAVKPEYSNTSNMEKSAPNSTALDASLHTICSQDSIPLEDLCLSTHNIVQSLDSKALKSSEDDLSFHPSIMETCDLEDLNLVPAFSPAKETTAEIMETCDLEDLNLVPAFSPAKETTAEEDAMKKENTSADAASKKECIPSEPLVHPGQKARLTTCQKEELNEEGVAERKEELSRGVQETQQKSFIKRNLSWLIPLLTVIVLFQLGVFEKVTPSFLGDEEKTIKEDESINDAKIFKSLGMVEKGEALLGIKTHPATIESPIHLHHIPRLEEFPVLIHNHTMRLPTLQFKEEELLSPLFSANWASLGNIWQVFVILALWIHYFRKSRNKNSSEVKLCKNEKPQSSSPSRKTLLRVQSMYDLSAYERLSVVELRQMVRKRGCQYTDKKARLVLRLAAVYEAELRSLTVVQLRRKLKSKGMKQGGLKKDLIQRLVEFGL